MNAKQEINAALNDFLGDVAGNYGELVTKAIPEMKFKMVIDAVARARAITRDNLVDITRRAVVEAVEAVQPAEIQPDAMISQLVPDEVAEAFATPTQHSLEENAAARDYVGPQAGQVGTGQVKDLAPATHLPGYTGDGVNSADGHGTPTNPGSMIMEGDDFVGMDDGPIDHQPPTMTLAEESRMAAGLPVKLKRPEIHTGRGEPGTAVVGPLPIPEAPKEAVSEVKPLKVKDPHAVLEEALTAIERLMVPHIESKNTELATVACTALTHLVTARGVVANMIDSSLEDEDDVEEDPADV